VEGRRSPARCPSGRSLLVGFAIVLGALGLYVLARSTPMFAVGKIEVGGRSAGGRGPRPGGAGSLEGRKPAYARLFRGRAAAREAPRCRGRGLRPDFPHTLRVTVRPEHPVAVARRGPKAWLVAASTRTIAEVPLRTHARPSEDLAGASNDPEGRARP
jgi:hypothetical protein